MPSSSVRTCACDDSGLGCCRPRWTTIIPIVKNTLAPGIATVSLHAPSPRLATRHHAKTVRFFRQLSDADVLELVAQLDKTLAVSGMEPGPLRQALMRFAAGAP